jgi:hypothetical protein
MQYFLFIFFILWFKLTKTTLQNCKFNFQHTPHILYMLFKKSYDLVLWFLGKTFWKFSTAENIENATFYFIRICPRFVFSLLFTMNHKFSNESTVLEKSIKALFNPNLKKLFHRNLPNCWADSTTVWNLFHSAHEKNVGFFRFFSKILNFRF